MPKRIYDAKRMATKMENKQLEKDLQFYKSVLINLRKQLNNLSNLLD